MNRKVDNIIIRFGSGKTLAHHLGNKGELDSR